MTNNDILRRIRYIFAYNDTSMMNIFAHGGLEATRAQISSWLKQDNAEGYASCKDEQLSAFLNGLIIEKRGKREGEQPANETEINNNLVLIKLKIALSLQSDDIQELLKSVDFRLSNHELSAFFRKPGHKHYRPCKDQVLRNILNGLQHKLRPGSDA